MKKILPIVLIAIVLVYFMFSSRYTYAISYKTEGFDVYEPEKYIKEDPCNDILTSVLLPYVQKSVTDYYSKILTDIPTVDPWGINILSVDRPNGEGTFVFVLEIEIKPYVGPHLGVGLDHLTITVDGIGTVVVNKFHHIEDYDLPPYYQSIIK